MSPRALAAGLTGVGLLATVGAFVVVRTTEQSRDPLWLHVVLASVGLVWVLAGAAATARRPDNRTGLLMAGIGLAWLASSLSSADWSPAFTLGLLISPLWVAMLLHLILVFPEGRLRTRVETGLTVAGYALIMGLQVPSLMVSDGARQSACEPRCPENVLQVAESTLALDVLEVIRAVGVSAVVVGVVWVVVRRWRTATPLGRRVLAPVLGIGLVAILLLLAALVVEEVSHRTAIAIQLAGLIAFGAVPVGFLVGLVRARLARGGVEGLVVELGEASLEGGVRAALARSLGDPTLELAYWLPEEAAYVDATGARVEPARDGSRATTVVAHRGERIALLVHDPALRDRPALVDAACAAAGMALANERLQAELRRSRARIVAAADAARRRLERDLHDGAQQRLVSLAIILRRAEDSVDGAPAARDLILRARAELDDALAGLRELARGIHPAVLTDRGLAAALRALADRSSTAVALAVDLDERPPPEVEVAAYYVVSEAVTNAAKHAAGAPVTVTAREGGGRLVVRVADAGPGGAVPAPGGGLQGLADRVEAVGGRLVVEDGAGGGTVVTADLPLRAPG